MAKDKEKSLDADYYAGKRAELNAIGELDRIMSPEDKMCKVPKVEVLFNNILTSCHSITHKSILIDPNDRANLSTRQVVVVAGKGAQVKVGDWIEINVEMFQKERLPGKNDVGTVVKYHPPIEKIRGIDYLYLSDRHVKYILK